MGICRVEWSGMSTVFLLTCLHTSIHTSMYPPPPPTWLGLGMAVKRNGGSLCRLGSFFFLFSRGVLSGRMDGWMDRWWREESRMDGWMMEECRKVGWMDGWYLVGVDVDVDFDVDVMDRFDLELV